MSLGRNATYNLIGQAAPVVVSLVSIPIYLRLVGIERYGVLAIAWMLLGYFGLFDLGLTRATSYRIALRRDASPLERATTFWTAVSLSLCLAVTGAVLLYFGGRWYFSGPFEVAAGLRAEALQALPILSLSLPGAILAGVLNGALQGRERFLEVNVIGVFSSVAAQVVPVLIAWMVGPRLVWLLSGSVAVQFVAIAILWVRCRRHVVANHRYVTTRAEAGDLLRFGGWITVSATLSPIMVVVDRFVIGSLLNAAAVATYSVPAQIAQRVSMIPYAMATALFPRLSAEGQGGQSSRLSLDATRAAMAVMTPVVMFGIFAIAPFLHVWLNGALAPEAMVVGQILLAGWWVNGLAINPFALLQAGGRPRIPALLHLAELPIYGALLWGLTTRFGLAGAAGAFTARCAIDCFALNYMAYRRLDGLLPYAFPAILLALAIAAVEPMRVDTFHVAAALVLQSLAIAWSAMVMPRHLRQSLLVLLTRKLRIRHVD